MNSRARFNSYTNVVHGFANGEKGRPKEHAGGAHELAPKATKPSTVKWIVEFPHPTLYGKTKVLSLDDYRRQDRLSSSDQEFDDYPILLRHALNESGETNKYQLELQSKELKDYFASIAKPYRQINVDADPIVIARPFRPLFFLRDTMKQKAESDETSPELKQNINSVIDFINSKEDCTMWSKSMRIKFLIKKFRLTCYGHSTPLMSWFITM